MTSVEPCTTWAQRKRHYSTSLAPAQYGAGRQGRTLCQDDGQDEERANHHNTQYSKRLVAIADLPECKRCARILAKENS
jgi:hypothetical protein